MQMLRNPAKSRGGAFGGIESLFYQIHLNKCYYLVTKTNLNEITEKHDEHNEKRFNCYRSSWNSVCLQ
jgi:hypothetical protein